MSDRLLQDARGLDREQSLLNAEAWASGWLGHSWLAAPLGQRSSEAQLLLEVVGRASTRPSSHGLAAVTALARVVPEDDRQMLAGTVRILAESQPQPAFDGAAEWRPVAAWRAVDVWDSERVLFVDFDGPERHTLMASLVDLHGWQVDRLALLQAGAGSRWEALREPGDVPMPLAERPVDDVLAELAAALRHTDMLWPRQDDEDFVELRALAWSRCRPHLPDWPDSEPISDDERHGLIDEFVASSDVPDDDVTRSLADVFVDYGDGYLSNRPLGWSPTAVSLFLGDWVPRKVALDAEQRIALPEVLRRWLRFALAKRGVEQRWIEPVVDTVDEHLADFEEAFDDESSWGPAKQIAAALAERGVDLSDHEAVELAMREYNAEQLARRLQEDS